LKLSDLAVKNKTFLVKEKREKHYFFPLTFADIFAVFRHGDKKRSINFYFIDLKTTDGNRRLIFLLIFKCKLNAKKWLAKCLLLV
jgi:hypothetical protein